MSINTCKDCIHLAEETGLDVCLVDQQPVDRPGLGICSFFEPLPTLKPVDLLYEICVGEAIRKHPRSELLATYELMVDFKFLRGRKHNRIRLKEE